jgi:hypothetical protein
MFELFRGTLHHWPLSPGSRLVDETPCCVLICVKGGGNVFLRCLIFVVSCECVFFRYVRWVISIVAECNEPNALNVLL